MRMLITGATGFIGGALARRCGEQGHSVTAFGRVNDDWERRRSKELSDTGIEVVIGSVLDLDILEKICKDKDAVVHLAAAQHESNVGDDYFWRINVQGTESLLNASIAAGVRRFLHGSTIGVYGSAAEGELDETSPLKPDNVYGRTKLEGERVAAAYCDRIPVSIVRISETYGPDDKRLLKLFRTIKSGRFFIIGSGRNDHHPVYIDDLVEGLLLDLHAEAAVGQTVNLAGATPVTTEEMVRSVAQAVGTRAGKLKIPLWPFDAAAILMEKTMPPIGLSPILTRRRLDFFRKSFSFSREKARSLLGFEPKVDFAEGARRCAEWYTAHGML